MAEELREAERISLFVCAVDPEVWTSGGTEVP